jgi:C-terminal processing protease CtpA/Prc
VFGFKRAGEADWDYVLDKESRIGYVWIRSIKASTLHELRTIDQRLNAAGMQALVVDFRFSRGDGLLQQASLVAGGLIDGGLMWTARGTQEKKEWHANRDPLFRDMPMAVLINDIEDNAQGAVLAALQDRGRAVLVGEPTKADGAIRRMFELPNKEGMVTVLTGQLERADKKRAWPVLPDRAVELTKTQRSAIERWLMSKQQPVLPPGTTDIAPEDPQLTAAVTVLRDALRAKVNRTKGSD